MKCFLVLPVLALAALGAPVLQPAPNMSLGQNRAGLPLPLSDYIWLDSLYGPPDTIYGGDTTIGFGAMLHASQPSPNTVVHWTLWTHDMQVYGDPMTFDLGAGDSTLVHFEYHIGGDTGHWTAVASIEDNQPTDSSVVIWQFCVVPRPCGAAEERHEPPAARKELQPAVRRSLLAGAVAFDAMGRRVLNPKPGVYFVRIGASALSAKVLLVE